MGKERGGALRHRWDSWCYNIVAQIDSSSKYRVAQIHSSNIVVGEHSSFQRQNLRCWTRKCGERACFKENHDPPSVRTTYSHVPDL